MKFSLYDREMNNLGRKFFLPVNYKENINKINNKDSSCKHIMSHIFKGYNLQKQSI